MIFMVEKGHRGWEGADVSGIGVVGLLAGVGFTQDERVIEPVQ